jgi:hypothetical protein
MGPNRIWFLSPALATAAFFGVQAVLALSYHRDASTVAAASANAPNPRHVKLRIVEQIRSAGGPRASSVPETEAQLLELFRRDGAVVFFQDEVEVVEISAREFDADEAGVITSRRGRLEPR